MVIGHLVKCYFHLIIDFHNTVKCLGITMFGPAHAAGVNNVFTAVDYFVVRNMGMAADQHIRM